MCICHPPTSTSKWASSVGRALVLKLTGPEFEPFYGYSFSSITIILIIWKFVRVNACTTLPFFIVLNFLLLVKDKSLFLIDINVQYTRKKTMANI